MVIMTNANDGKSKRDSIRVTCPECGNIMKVYGWIKDKWHYDPVAKSQLQHYYVSCACSDNLLKQTRELREIPQKNPQNNRRYSLTIETKVTPLPD